MDTLDKGMTHIPGGTKQDGLRFHHATQSNAQFETHELFSNGILPLIFLDCSWPQGDYCSSRKEKYSGVNLTKYIGSVCGKIENADERNQDLINGKTYHVCGSDNFIGHSCHFSPVDL